MCDVIQQIYVVTFRAESDAVAHTAFYKYRYSAVRKIARTHARVRKRQFKHNVRTVFHGVAGTEKLVSARRFGALGKASAHNADDGFACQIFYFLHLVCVSRVERVVFAYYSAAF